MIELYKHLRDARTRRAYFGLLFKRHRALLAYALIVMAAVVAFDRSNDATVERLERTIFSRCLAVNEFRENTNYQFDLFVNHNNAAVTLFGRVGSDLQQGADSARFRALGKEFSAASEHYRKLALKFRHVPYEDCTKAVRKIRGEE